MIEKVTAAMIEVEGEGMRPVTWVRIAEFEPGDWAIGGKRLKPADVLAMNKSMPPHSTVRLRSSGWSALRPQSHPLHHPVEVALVDAQ